MQLDKPFDKEQELQEETRDWTPWIWLGVAAVVLGMVAFFWLKGPDAPAFSYVHVRHILIKCDFEDSIDRDRALTQINDIKKRIEAGEDFGELARKFSMDPYSAANRGDLGRAKKGTYQGAFEEYVWSGEPGAISDVVRTTFGFHIVQILDRRYSKVEQHIKDQEDRLKEKARQEAEK